MSVTGNICQTRRLFLFCEASEFTRTSGPQYCKSPKRNDRSPASLNAVVSQGYLQLRAREMRADVPGSSGGSSLSLTERMDQVPHHTSPFLGSARS